MDDESLNGGDSKSSALSMEDEEELEEDGVSLTTTSSSAAATPPPQQHPPARGQRPPSRPPSEEATDPSAHSKLLATGKIPPTPLQTVAVKRRREHEPDVSIPGASRPSPPATTAVQQQPPPPPPALPTQHPLLSADLLHSLQYFALLRQSLPNGKFLFFFFFLVCYRLK
jgi:hypothetical protein